MWLECTISYWGDDLENCRRILIKRVVLIHSINYTDAETQASKWIEEKEIDEEYHISPIRELKIDAILSNEGSLYFLAKTIYKEYNERGKLKTYKFNVLVPAKDPEEATKLTKDFLKKAIPCQSEIKSIEVTNIEEVLSD